MKVKLSIVIISMLAFTLTGCTQINNKNDNNTGSVWIANPASVYCEENWWTLELIFDNGESYGVCNFEDWSFCEEREFYHGECANEKNETNLDTNTGTISDTELKTQKMEEISAIFQKYKNINSPQTSWLNEQDIELMEEIIKTLK